MRLDAEVREGLEQRLGGALDRLLGLALLGVGARALEDARVGKLVAGVLGRGHVEDGLGPLGKLRLEVVELVDEDGGRLGVLPDDVGIRRGAVHGRRVRLRDRLVFERNADAFDGAARGHGRLLRRVGRMADERAERCAGDEQRSRDDEEEAENGGAGVAEEAAEDEVQRLAGAPPARFAEDGHDAEAEDDEAGAERPHVDQLGAGDQEAADGEQDEWDSDAARADESIEGRSRSGRRRSPRPSRARAGWRGRCPRRRARARASSGCCCPRAPFERERFFLRTRDGDFGRRCFERFLGAMNASSSERGALLPRIFWSVRSGFTLFLLAAVGILAALALADALRPEGEAGPASRRRRATTTRPGPPTLLDTLRDEAVSGFVLYSDRDCRLHSLLLPRMIDDVVRDEGGADVFHCRFDVDRRPDRLQGG